MWVSTGNEWTVNTYDENSERAHATSEAQTEDRTSTALHCGHFVSLYLDERKYIEPYQVAAWKTKDRSPI